MRYGSWWSIQHRTCGWSIGLHYEPHTHHTNAGIPYGPYLDVHFAHWVFSVGRNPIYAGELELLVSYSRGGLNANCH